MSIGGSGRIVIEIDPATKRELYAALQRDQKTLKEWFLIRAEEYVTNSGQLSMFSNETRQKMIVKAQNRG